MFPIGPVTSNMVAGGTQSGMTAGQAQLASAGIQAAGGFWGMFGQRKREKRAMAHQKELMDIQFKNQQELNKQGQQIQMETWKNTNYPAQMKMLKEAGLNPALLYGKGGQGGVTGSQGGGGAAGGNAPAPQPMPMELTSLLKQQAEINLLNAQAKREEAQAEKTKGVDTQEALSRINVNEGIITLNLSTEDLNEVSKQLKQSEMEVNESVVKLNNVLGTLHSQKVKESIAATNIDNATLKWMEETGLNPADSTVAKMLNYLSRETGIEEDALIYIIGGAIGVRELGNLVSKFIFKKAPTEILKTGTVKGFGGK